MKPICSSLYLEVFLFEFVLQRLRTNLHRQIPEMAPKVKKFLKQRVPITGWLPLYNSEKFICDVIAGITVGLTLMPQGLAYATLAGLEPQVNSVQVSIKVSITRKLTNA